MTPLSSSSRPLAWRLLHAFIVLHFVAEIFYTGYQTMIVLRPPGAGIAPLGDAAMTIDDSLFMKRRLYAIENWIAFGGLTIYLALTEMLPRGAKKKENAT